MDQNVFTRGRASTSASDNNIKVLGSRFNVKTVQENGQCDGASSICKDEPMDIDVPSATDPNLQSVRKSRDPIPTVYIDTPRDTPSKTIPIDEPTGEIPTPNGLGSPTTPPRTLRRAKKLSNNSEVTPSSPPPVRSTCMSIRRRQSAMQRSPSPQPPPTMPLPPLPVIITPPATPTRDAFISQKDTTSISSPQESPIPTPASPPPVAPKIPTSRELCEILKVSRPRKRLPLLTASRYCAANNIQPAPKVASPPTSPSSSKVSRSPELPGTRSAGENKDVVMADGVIQSPSSPPPKEKQTVPPLPPLAELEKYYRSTVQPAQEQKRYTAALEDEETELRLKKKPSKTVKERRNGGPRDRSNSGKYQFPLSLSLSLGRKRGKTVAGFEREKDILPPLPTNKTSGPRSSRSMAFAEQDSDQNGCGGYVFRPTGPSTDEVADDGRKKMLSKMKSTIGLVSTSSNPSPPKPTFGLRLKEMFGRRNGSEN